MTHERLRAALRRERQDALREQLSNGSLRIRKLTPEDIARLEAARRRRVGEPDDEATRAMVRGAW